MRKFVSKQKNCFIIMFALIAICEFFLKVDNRIIQSLGICLLPFIIFFVLLLIKNSEKKDINVK